MPAVLNRDSILKKVLRSESVQRKAAAEIRLKVDSAKEQLLEEFNNSPVTKEIEAGPKVEGSQILPHGYGNLFSFLGFEEGAEPITPVRNTLENIRLIKKPEVTARFWRFKIRFPSKEDLDDASPMHWETSRSWIDAVTYGLSGFSHYLFTLKRKVGQRSKTGVQVESNLRDSSEYFSGVSYVIGMLGRFKKRIIGK